MTTAFVFRARITVCRNGQNWELVFGCREVFEAVDDTLGGALNNVRRARRRVSAI